jgi:hypothetical protein
MGFYIPWTPGTSVGSAGTEMANSRFDREDNEHGQNANKSERWVDTKINFLNEIMKFIPRSVQYSLMGYSSKEKGFEDYGESVFNRDIWNESNRKAGKDVEFSRGLFEQTSGAVGIPLATGGKFSESSDGSFFNKAVNFHPTAVDFQHTAIRQSTKISSKDGGIDVDGDGKADTKANLTTTAYSSTQYSTGYLKELGIHGTGIVNYDSTFTSFTSKSRFNSKLSVEDSNRFTYRELSVKGNDSGDFASFLSKIKLKDGYVPNFFEIARSIKVDKLSEKEAFHLSMLMLESRRRFSSSMTQIYGANSDQVDIEKIVGQYGTGKNDFHGNGQDLKLDGAKVMYWRSIRTYMESQTRLAKLNHSDAETTVDLTVKSNFSLSTVLVGTEGFGHTLNKVRSALKKNSVVKTGLDKEKDLMDFFLGKDKSGSFLSNYTTEQIAHFAYKQEKKVQEKFVDIKMIDHLNQWMFGTETVNGVKRGHYPDSRRKDRPDKLFLDDKDRSKNKDDWKGQNSSQTLKIFFTHILNVQKYASFSMMQLFGDPDGIDDAGNKDTAYKGDGFTAHYEALGSKLDSAAKKDFKALKKFQVSLKKKVSSYLAKQNFSQKSIKLAAPIENFNDLEKSFFTTDVSKLESSDSESTEGAINYYQVIHDFANKGFDKWTKSVKKIKASSNKNLALNSAEVLKNLVGDTSSTRGISELNKAYLNLFKGSDGSLLKKVDNDPVKALQLVSQAYIKIQAFQDNYSQDSLVTTGDGDDSDESEKTIDIDNILALDSASIVETLYTSALETAYDADTSTDKEATKEEWQEAGNFDSQADWLTANDYSEEDIETELAEIKAIVGENATQFAKLTELVSKSRSLVGRILDETRQFNELVLDVTADKTTLNARIKSRFMDEFYMRGSFSAMRLTDHDAYYQENATQRGSGWYETSGRFTGDDTEMDLGKANYTTNNTSAAEEAKIKASTSQFKTLSTNKSSGVKVIDRADLQTWGIHAREEMKGFVQALMLGGMAVDMYNGSAKQAQAFEDDREKQNKEDETNRKISDAIGRSNAAKRRAHLASLGRKKR